MSLFKKPAGFNPFFVAKLTKKKKLLLAYVILLLPILGFNNALSEGDSDGMFPLIIIIIICVTWILFFHYLNKNPNIIEMSGQGIWLPLRRIFIPKDRFYKAFEVQEIRHTRVGEMKIKNVHIFFKISRNERRSLLLRLVATKKEYEISPTQYQVTVPIPYTVGRGDDILLNVSKTELIRVLNNLKN